MPKATNRRAQNDLIIVSSSLDETNRIATLLRDAGITIRSQQATDISDLTTKLSNHSKLIICDFDHYPIDFPALQTYRQSAGCLAPVIVLTKIANPELKQQAYKLGIADIIDPTDQELLQHAARRELTHHRLRLERYKFSRLQKETQQHYLSLIADTHDAITFIHDGVHLHANNAYLELFGFSNIADLDSLPFLDLLTAKDYEPVKSAIRAAIQGQTRIKGLTVTCVKNDGSTFDASLRLSTSRLDDESCVQFVLQPIKKQNNGNVLALPANRDPDTGLLNRRSLLTEIESVLSEKNNSSQYQALFYIELDDFENTRLTYGYASCELLLKQLSQKLIQASDPKDILARYGDYSFVLLTNRDNFTEFNQLGKQICTSLVQSVFQSGFNAITPSCSIGIALFDTDITDDIPTLDKAYQACRLAANNGGNQFVFYSSNKSKAENVVVPSSLIHAALEQDRFRLVFQPLMSLKGNTQENFVAMIRLLDNDDREITAHSFLKQVENAGLMNAIDRWIIEHAIQLLAQRHTDGHKTRLFLTLSGSSIEDTELPLWINECIKKHAVQGEWLVFQLHESSARNRLEKTKSLCHDLLNLGCQVAIDRLGLTPEPAKLLHHLGASYAKFDPFFIDQLVKDKRKQERLQLLNQSLQEREIQTIATSVENADSLSILWNLELDFIQGYFLQKPSANMTYDFNMDSL